MHILFNDYGGRAALNMLKSFMTTLRDYMTNVSFSIGMADVTPSPAVREGVKTLIVDARAKVLSCRAC